MTHITITTTVFDQLCRAIRPAEIDTTKLAALAIEDKRALYQGVLNIDCDSPHFRANASWAIDVELDLLGTLNSDEQLDYLEARCLGKHERANDMLAEMFFEVYEQQIQDALAWIHRDQVMRGVSDYQNRLLATA